MANRLAWNSRTLDFEQLPTAFQIEYLRNVLENRSASGECEVLNVSFDVRVAFSWRRFVNSVTADATQKRKLQQWFQYSQGGGAFTFARDSAKTVSTTLTGAEAAGQTVIGLASTTGLTAGDTCVIRSKLDGEVVKILTVDSGVQVTLVEPLDSSYASGSRFRHEQYWAGRLMGARNPIIEVPPLWYDVDLSFYEDVNSL